MTGIISFLGGLERDRGDPKKRFALLCKRKMGQQNRGNRTESL